MTHSRARGVLLPVLCAPVLYAVSVSTQSDPTYAIQRRNDCRLASQTIRTGHPAPKPDWSLGAISTCGAEGGEAIAAALRVARTSTDTVLLDRLKKPTL